MENDFSGTKIYQAFEEDAPLESSWAEKGLLVAVLSTALSDLNKKGRDREQAVQYFLNRDEEYIFSFQSICTHLDIDPSRILVFAGLKQSDNADSKLKKETTPEAVVKDS